MSNNVRYSKLAKNSIIFAIANFGSNILRFLIVPFYTYYMTNAEYGTVDTLTTTISLLLPIMLLAVQEAVLRFTLNKQVNSVSALKNSLLVMTVGSIIFLLGYYPFHLIQIFHGLWWYFYALLLSHSLNNILLNFTRGSGKSVTFMFGGLINTVVMLISNVLLIAVLRRGTTGYLTSLIIGYSVSSLFLMIMIRPVKIWENGGVDLDLLREMLRYSIPLIPTAAMWWIMNVADRYSIAFFLGISYTGIYAISHKVPSVISMCYAIFQQAWQISAVDESESSDRSLFYKEVYDFFFRGLFMVSSLVILIIKPLISHIVESTYVDAWRYAPILVLSAVFSSMAGFLGVNYVVSQKTIGALTTSAFGAITNVVLNLLFIPLIGIQGAAIATLIGFYGVWIVRASVSTGGIKISQNYLIIHVLLFLELLQTLVLVKDIPYQAFVQIMLFLLILIINKNVLKRISSRGIFVLKNLMRSGKNNCQ